MMITLPRKTHARPILQVRGSQASRVQTWSPGALLVLSTKYPVACLGQAADVWHPLPGARQLAVFFTTRWGCGTWTTCMALTVDGPVTSAEKLAWPGPRRRAGPLGPGPTSDFWSVAPLEMGWSRD
jgi:hypothetical protein